MQRIESTALLLGTFTNSDESIENYFHLTENAKIFDMNLKGALTAYLIADGPFNEEDKIKTLRFDDPTVCHYIRNYNRIAVMDLGPSKIPESIQNTNVKIENIFSGIAYGIRYFRERQFDVIYIDSCENPKIAGTAIALIMPFINNECNSDTVLSVKLFDEFHFGDDRKLEYENGMLLGKGQRVAQHLMKSTSVFDFIKTAKSYLKEFELEIVERTEPWLEKKKMNSLLSTVKKSGEPPVILEITFNNSKKPSKPLILVGKATPYESSLFPLCDKPEFHQFQYRSGMGGASSIIGSLYSLCMLQPPVWVHCIIAVVWNQLHDKPNKNGSIVHTMNGTSIQIDRPEAEGRLIMADILCYTNTVDSSTIVDVTTLSSNIDSILGNSYIGFFTADESLKRKLFKASRSTGEKVWQLPLYKRYSDLLKISTAGHVSNVGADKRSVTTCKSACFLKEFVKETTPWMHLDISAVTECQRQKIYCNDWATGQSTRLLTEFCLEFFEED